MPVKSSLLFFKGTSLYVIPNSLSEPISFPLMPITSSKVSYGLPDMYMISSPGLKIPDKIKLRACVPFTI